MCNPYYCCTDGSVHGAAVGAGTFLTRFQTTYIVFPDITIILNNTYSFFIQTRLMFKHTEMDISFYAQKEVIF